MAVATLPIIALVASGPVDELANALRFQPWSSLGVIWRALAFSTLGLAVAGALALPIVVAIGRRRPDRLVDLLEPTARIGLVGLAVLTVAEGMLAAGILFIAWGQFQGSPGAVGAFALQALISSLAGVLLVSGFVGARHLIQAARKYNARSVPLVGVPLPIDQQPGLQRLISDVARRLPGPEPNHLILEPDLSFSIRDAPVVVGDETLEGTSLRLSWPLMHLLSVPHLEAVIAHELAHVAAEHGETSGRLARGLDRMQQALFRLEAEERKASQSPLSWLATKPAILWIRHLLATLGDVVSLLERQHELAADKAGSRMAGAWEMATALRVISAANAAAYVWTNLLLDPRAIEQLAETSPTPSFRKVVAQVLEDEDLGGESTGDSPVSWDSRIGERLVALGVGAAAPLRLAEVSAATLLTGEPELGRKLLGLIRDTPDHAPSAVINRPRVGVGIAMTWLIFGLLIALAIYVYPTPPSLAKAGGLILLLATIEFVAVVAVLEIGLQQAVLIDDAGIAAPSWLRLIARRRGRVMPWSSRPTAVVGALKSIRLLGGGRSLHIRMVWWNNPDREQLIDALRAREVPIRFRQSAWRLNDERRAAIWWTGDGFLVPTLRRRDDGTFVEAEPVRRLPADRAALFGVLQKDLAKPPGTFDRRTRKVELAGGQQGPAAGTDQASSLRRRMTVAAYRTGVSVRVDGLKNPWRAAPPTSTAALVDLAFDVFGVNLPPIGTEDEIDQLEA